MRSPERPGALRSMGGARSDGLSAADPSGNRHRAARLPRTPVLDWNSFAGMPVPCGPAIDELDHTALTTSGRAALYQALLQLRLPRDTPVLLPTYHCPTMVAPVVCAGLQPRFYPLGADGLPRLDRIDPGTAPEAGAIIVAHYFGLPRSLAAVRQWCDRHRIALIEDCAHCYFGLAGERPIGAWGDFSTASLTKFFPVAEAGLLACAARPLAPLELSSPGARQEFKGVVDVLEQSVRHDRLAGLRAPLSLLLRLKNQGTKPRPPDPAAEPESDPSSEQMMRDCDMARIREAPPTLSRLLKSLLPRGRLVAQRRINFDHYAAGFAGIAGARPLFEPSRGSAVPYAFPLWVDEADRVYRALRLQQLPVFRWDRVWSGTPASPDDHGHAWSRHVLQLLCHQNLAPCDIDRVIDATRTALRNASRS